MLWCLQPISLSAARGSDPNPPAEGPSGSRTPQPLPSAGPHWQRSLCHRLSFPPVFPQAIAALSARNLSWLKVIRKPADAHLGCSSPGHSRLSAGAVLQQAPAAPSCLQEAAAPAVVLRCPRQMPVLRPRGGQPYSGAPQQQLCGAPGPAGLRGVPAPGGTVRGKARRWQSRPEHTEPGGCQAGTQQQAAAWGSAESRVRLCPAPPRDGESEGL